MERDSEREHSDRPRKPLRRTGTGSGVPSGASEAQVGRRQHQSSCNLNFKTRDSDGSYSASAREQGFNELEVVLFTPGSLSDGATRRGTLPVPVPGTGVTAVRV
jgi:hypothetical protein